jgi:acyl-CoA thioesterase-1
MDIQSRSVKRGTSHGLRALVAVTFVLAGGIMAYGAQFNVVALGASNTAGFGVKKEEAFPARLEALLKAKGYDVQVTNAGISGDTTGNMVARLDKDVGKDVKAVVLQPGGNDAKAGVKDNLKGNVQAIVGKLKARGVTTVILTNVELLKDLPAGSIQPDKIHLTAKGHQETASRLLPRVMEALSPAK